MSNQEHIVTAHVQTAPHLYSPCPVCTPFLQPMSRQYPMYSAHVQPQASLQPMVRDYAIYIVHLQTKRHICSTSTAQRVHHIYTTYTVRAHTISLAYVQLVHNLSCPRPVSTPYLLLITSKNPTSPAHGLYMSSKVMIYGETEMPYVVIVIHILVSYHIFEE